MSTLPEFLLARIAEDEAWSEAASRHDEEPLVEGGEHWQWECDTHDVVVRPDPLTSEYLVCPVDPDDFRISLRSRELYPYRSISGNGPNIHVHAEETSSVVAGHIARHDPARVLVECQAKRRIVDLHAGIHECVGAGPGGWMGVGDDAEPCPTLRALAAVYADHLDYREEWLA